MFLLAAAALRRKVTVMNAAMPKRLAVLTSGGDAPGMNAAIRAVVRTGLAHGYEVLGIRHGYSGLIEGDFRTMTARDVGGIIERGGTILGTSRCERLKTDAGCTAAIRQLEALQLDSLVVIGGNGSHAGATRLSKAGARIIAVASTIDNDVPSADITIGASTALETAVDAIDRLRVTASAHGRVFLVEVMGRDSGHLALLAGVAGGAEAIVLPEIEVDPEGIAAEISGAYDRGKSHAIVVVAEGARYNADALAEYFRSQQARLGFELRVTKLGHIQRGGIPCVYDRIIASQLGAAAVDHAVGGEFGLTLGVVNGVVTSTPFAALQGAVKSFDHSLFNLAKALAH
jgi:6-phosphofructokinase 1